MFGERYRQIMKSHQLRNRDICERTGFSRSTVSHLLADDKAPSFETLQYLIRAIPDIRDLYWLITGDDQ